MQAAGRRISPLGWLGIALVVAIVLLAVFGGLNLAASGGYYGMMGSGSWGWAVTMMVIPAVLLIVVLLAAVRGLGPRANPLGVLDERYARGELTREEYLRIRADLTRGTSGSGGA